MPPPPTADTQAITHAILSLTEEKSTQELRLDLAEVGIAAALAFVLVSALEPSANYYVISLVGILITVLVAMSLRVTLRDYEARCQPIVLGKSTSGIKKKHQPGINHPPEKRQPEFNQPPAHMYL